MSFISKEKIDKARGVDLLTYLQQTAPQELVPIGNGAYKTRTHDSLKISNGKWCWWSHGIGGVSALDYLIKVEGIPFQNAVFSILRGSFTDQTQRRTCSAEHKTEFQLPERHVDNRRVFSYLYGRGIDPEIINHCIKHGQLYEDKEYHNCVFIGFDGDFPKYAMLRGTNSKRRFVREITGSDKRFPFAVPLLQTGITVYVFESAIDVLSYLSILKLQGKNWRKICCLSLGGVQRPGTKDSFHIPPALAQYLQSNQTIHQIVLCFDTDETGRMATQAIIRTLPEFRVIDLPPKEGKDYNEFLLYLKQRKIEIHNIKEVSNE